VREGFDNSADLTDWVYRNGEVVAATDRPIFAGATERWSDSADSVFTFIANVTNNLGEYVIAGTTDSSDLDRDLVFVFNGTTEVLREGDPVDVNGDGVFDDDAFLDGSILDYDDAFLTDAGIFHFNARLRNGAGEYLGQAFMAKDLRAVSAAVPEPGSAGLLAAPAAVGLLLATVRRRRRLRA